MTFQSFQEYPVIAVAPLLLLNSSKSTFNAIRWVAFAFCIGTEKSKQTLQIGATTRGSKLAEAAMKIEKMKKKYPDIFRELTTERFLRHY